MTPKGCFFLFLKLSVGLSVALVFVFYVAYQFHRASLREEERRREQEVQVAIDKFKQSWVRAPRVHLKEIVNHCTANRIRCNERYEDKLLKIDIHPGRIREITPSYVETESYYLAMNVTSKRDDSRLQSTTASVRCYLRGKVDLNYGDGGYTQYEYDLMEPYISGLAEGLLSSRKFVVGEVTVDVYEPQYGKVDKEVDVRLKHCRFTSS